MPKTTYSQVSIRSLHNREASFDGQTAKKTKKKVKIYKPKLKNQKPATKPHKNKVGNKVSSTLRYKSAFSPQYIIQIHDIEMSSLNSDDIGPANPHSSDEMECKQAEIIPLANLSSQEIYRRFHEDYEKRDLERIMRACKVTDQSEGNMVE